MTREEIKDFCDMKVQLEPENEDIFKAIVKALEQEPCEDWYDISSDEMTLEQARQAVKDLRKRLMEYLEQEPRWIPVSEYLPVTNDEVLCWYEYYHWSQEKVLPEYGLGCYFKETKSWFGEVANGKDVRVIAWMPLPKPFEPQESEEV